MSFWELLESILPSVAGVDHIILMSKTLDNNFEGGRLFQDYSEGPSNTTLFWPLAKTYSSSVR